MPVVDPCTTDHASPSLTCDNTGDDSVTWQRNGLTCDARTFCESWPRRSRACPLERFPLFAAHAGLAKDFTQEAYADLGAVRIRNEDPDSAALHVLVMTTSVRSVETKLPESTHEAITADRAKPRHLDRDSRVNVDVDAIDHRQDMSQVVTQCDPAFQDGAQLLAACL